MTKLLYTLNSVPDDEAEDIKNLLAQNKIDFYETPAGNWGISLHALWLKNEDQYPGAKQLIEDYQIERAERVRQETSQRTNSDGAETFFQRIVTRPLQFIGLLAFIAFILYFTIMPFLQFGQL